MVSRDTIEGIINDAVWFHYSASDDVLYLRRNNARQADALGEESDDGLIVLCDESTGEMVGVTIVNWWKRFGHGELPDSLRELEQLIQPWTRKLAA